MPERSPPHAGDPPPPPGALPPAPAGVEDWRGFALLPDAGLAAAPARTAAADHATAALAMLFDAAWYLHRYADVAAARYDPLKHFVALGLGEERDPNPFFAGGWYRSHYADVGAGGQHPLLHYLRIGAARGDNPHPRFDAAWYVEQHPEAAGNPLLYHLRIGRARGWATEPAFDPAAFLPATGRVPTCPPEVAVDVVVPVYRGFAETRRCLESVLADPARPPGRVIVVDDATPEPALASWLDSLRAAGRIVLLRQARNQGFVVAANRGMDAAAPHDAVLLNADTEVPPGWLGRLAGHAYAAPRIASVSPFSNNATICGWPSREGGPPAFGRGVAELDAVCQAANAGRSVAVPTTVGFCMYIRRAALDAVGGFDAATFGRGYGEENDFCLRAAAAGWQHRLACDIFVFHQGAVSFGAAQPGLAAAQTVLAARWPAYPGLIARHIRQDPATPARFAATAALLRADGRPVVLLVGHGLGGGVGRHMDEQRARAAGAAHFVLLTPHPRGVALAFPDLPDQPEAALPGDGLAAPLTLLRSVGVTRVHVHHVMGFDFDVAALIRGLDVPFDVTVHDYYPLCPQVNLLPWGDAQYCGEPGPAGCNACIAARPSHGARDITAWRRRHLFLFLAADRVFCPSRDAFDRLARHGWAGRAVLAPHEPAATFPPPRPARALRADGGGALRIALLGVLAPQKGAAVVATAAELADPRRFAFHLLGAPERPLPGPAARRITVTGAYAEGELPGLLARARPDVVWFPAQWPETYSYTLSTALAAGLPIVASAIGAFPERLAGRALTWLVDPAAPAADWLAVFGQVRAALAAEAAPAGDRTPGDRSTGDGTAEDGPAGDETERPGAIRPARRRGAAPLAADRARRSVVIVPECFDDGTLTPCAYIRLLLPLDHPRIGAGLDVTIAPRGVPTERLRADTILTHRNAIATTGEARALIRHCRRNGITLAYDLDDDLLALPAQHPDAARLAPLAPAVALLLAEADIVSVSTPPLAAALSRRRPDARVLANGLDERLWADPLPARLRRGGAVRILYMGSQTHAADFALVVPALERLLGAFGPQIGFDMIGISAGSVPGWVSRIGPPPTAASYPAFVNWLVQQGSWDIGIAPLAQGGSGARFNAGKSGIKALEYAALGMVTVASDGPAYRGSCADGAGGILVPDTEAAWCEALARLVRDPGLRARLAAGGRDWLAAHGTLAAQTATWRAAWGPDAPPPHRAGTVAVRARKAIQPAQDRPLK
ncbi:MAG: glycosyltransferase [Proteobacteria bacterium]|nr:glycosyltransferase [Pseudomonadota bacterium]